MKNVALKDNKKSEKRCQKVFTKKKRNSKIEKDSNLSEVNYKIYEREVMHMKKEREDFIELLFKICEDLGVEDSQKEVKLFLEKTQRND